MKRKWNKFTENIRRDKRMTGTFEEDSYEDDSVILESKVKAVLKVWGRNKSPVVGGIPVKLFQPTDTESVKVLTRLCQQIWKAKQCSVDWKHSVIQPSL